MDVTAEVAFDGDFGEFGCVGHTESPYRHVAQNIQSMLVMSGHGLDLVGLSLDLAWTVAG